MATIREMVVRLGFNTDTSQLVKARQRIKAAEKRIEDFTEKAEQARRKLQLVGDETGETRKEIQGFEAGIRKAQKSMDGWIQRADYLQSTDRKFRNLRVGVGQLSEGFSTAAKMGAAFFAVVAGGVGILIRITHKASEYAETVVRSADAFQTSIAQYQKLQFAFDAVGASTDDLADALGTLTDRAVDAREGSKTYRKEFNRIGISMKELNNAITGGPGAIFTLVADKSAAAADKTQVLTSMVRLLGDDLGRRLMPALVGSRESFAAFETIAEKSGIVLEDKLVHALRNLRFRTRLLGATLQGLIRRLAAEFAPLLNSIVKDIIFFIKKMAEAGKISKIFEFISREVSQQLNKLIEDFKALYERLGGAQGVINVLKATAVAIGLVSTAMGGFAAAKMAAGVSNLIASLAAAGPAAAAVVAIGVGIAALALVLGDLHAFASGQNSLIGELVEDFEAFGYLVRTAVVFFRAIDSLLGSVLDDVKGVWAAFQGFMESLGFSVELFDIIKVVLGVIIGLVIGVVAWFVTFFVALPLLVIKAIGAIIEIIADLVAYIAGAYGALWQGLVDGGLQGALKSFYNYFVDTFDSVFDYFSETWDKITNALSEAGDFITGEAEISAADGQLTAAAAGATASAANGGNTDNSTKVESKTEVGTIQVVSNGDNPAAQGEAVAEELAKRNRTASRINSGRSI